MNNPRPSAASATSNLPLPNVYFASITSHLDGQTRHLYVAADFSGAATAKVANVCAERFGFRPYRSNSVIKLRRLLLTDYLENPAALTEALITAHELGERDTVERLKKRPQEVEALLACGTAGGSQIDAEEIMRKLGEALRESDPAAV